MEDGGRGLTIDWTIGLQVMIGIICRIGQFQPLVISRPLGLGSGPPRRCRTPHCSIDISSTNRCRSSPLQRTATSSSLGSRQCATWCTHNAAPYASRSRCRCSSRPLLPSIQAPPSGSGFRNSVSPYWYAHLWAYVRLNPTPINHSRPAAIDESSLRLRSRRSDTTETPTPITIPSPPATHLPRALCASPRRGLAARPTALYSTAIGWP